MIVRTPAALGAAIRDRRLQLALTQRALADQVGVSRHWIIDVETGKSGSEIGLIFQTLRTLGIVLTTDSTPPSTPQKAPRKKPAVDLDALIEAARKPRRR